MIGNRAFKDLIYEQFARIGKAISSPKRLELLELISQGGKTVETLAKETGLSFANTSRHLQVLKEARLVTTERKKQFVMYRLGDRVVEEFLLSMRKIGENRLAEIEQISRNFFESREGLREVKREELIRLVHSEEVTLLDVRPEEEFVSGHIPGAISIPLKELESRLQDLPKDEEIVAYCRGPYCVLALQAVELLKKNGFHALRLEESVLDWKAMGFPVEMGE